MPDTKRSLTTAASHYPKRSSHPRMSPQRVHLQSRRHLQWMAQCLSRALHTHRPSSLKDDVMIERARQHNTTTGAVSREASPRGSPPPIPHLVLLRWYDVFSRSKSRTTCWRGEGAESCHWPGSQLQSLLSVHTPLREQSVSDAHDAATGIAARGNDGNGGNGAGGGDGVACGGDRVT